MTAPTSTKITPRAILFCFRLGQYPWGILLRVIGRSENAVFGALGMPRWSLAETKARTRASLRSIASPHASRRQGQEAGRIFL